LALILHIETATDVCSVCLALDGIVTCIEESNTRNNHATALHVMIDRLMVNQKHAYEDLDAIAVSMGPGSYTGLRIGVAAAKGFCFALDKPLIAINTLQAMTCSFLDHNPDLKDKKEALFCPMIDARRMEVYTALFDSNLTFVNHTSAMIANEDSFENLLKKNPIYFFGDGAQKVSRIIHHQNASFDNNFSTSSSGLCSAAFMAWKAREFRDTAYFEPFYLKDFIAGSKKQPNPVDKK
jgi:tRNA threonylcarbamoyladenosine biosynthesis protein TsaB